MDEMTEWSESDKTLYVAVVPILALIAVLVLLAVATSSSRHASAASGVPAKVDMSTLAIAERVRDGAIATRRKLYADCYADMGLQTGVAAQLVHPEKRSARSPATCARRSWRTACSGCRRRTAGSFRARPRLCAT